MLPAALTSQIQLGMADFLSASFTSSTAAFDVVIDEFVATAGELLQGPYVSLKLPFLTGSGRTNSNSFPDVPLRYPPYAHQEKAFRRLADGRNTIVATGTGSGKTECFLVPILAECARRVGERGIKAILIYPMNALASDQAERLAELIHDNEALRGKVTAGIYVGSKEKSPHGTMGERHIISDREVIRQNPPDILLTNYKMLDYLLIRPEDQPLWRDNGTETLSYLVVDELHTFDGAQGTDLACLLRRLEARLKVPAGHLTYVGTSATLGGEGAKAQLVEYATEVFGAEFDDDAVVTEERQTVDQFLAGAFIRYVDPVGIEHLEELDPGNFEDEASYLRKQVELWFPKLVQGDDAAGWHPALQELGEALKEHVFFHNLLKVLDRKVLTVDEVVEHFQRGMSNFRDGESRYARLVVLSLLSLISAARSPGGGPFMQVQLQLWVREMRRMVASVGERPRLRFFDDLTAEQRQRHLPVIHCRECGAMGWATLVYKDKPNHYSVDLKTFYKSYFQRDPRVTYIYPAEDGPAGARYWLDTDALRKQSIKPDDRGQFIEIVVPENVVRDKGTAKLSQDCAVCGANQSTALVGFQVSTLTSTFINQLFASRFNDDKKLLTFSDSVQDAAHRAGFFEARTWRFNLRIAIQQALEAAARDVPLAELPDVVYQHWAQKLSPEAFVSTFIAPDMTWLQEWEALVETGTLPVDSELPGLIRDRITWEVHAEYGLDARIGRSLPRTGSSVPYVDPQRLERAVAHATEELRNRIGPLRELSPDTVRRILVGIVTHLRERGAIFPPDPMSDYLASGGSNSYSLSRVGRRLRYMPAYGSRSRLPSFLTNVRGTRRFHTLDAGTPEGRTWYQTWFERNVEDVAPLLGNLTVDALHSVIEALVDAEILELRTPGGANVWGIRNDALLVSANPATNQREQHRGPGENPLVGVRGQSPREDKSKQGNVGASPQTPPGTPSLDPDFSQPSYYAKLYSRGEVQRIRAAEHTGLLERDARQAVEERFKSDDPRPWDPNLLSCTPTLEMGIDIGALSSAILCSVPPSQANFLQRVGRAGRRDGNSLLLTVAGARPHDLYFFASPREMIAGDVDTPGVYLNASAVLQRQLTAFCFDNWISTGVEKGALPSKLGPVFSQLEHQDRVDKFPHNLLAYIESQQTLLLERFVSMFADRPRAGAEPRSPGGDGAPPPNRLQPETVASLEAFMRGKSEYEGSLAWKILEGLHALRKDRDNLTASLDRLQARIDKLDALPVLDEAQSELLRELVREKAALVSLKRNLNDRPLLSFFTDEGLIPNYAFPEAGVSLKSIIWRRVQESADSEGNKYESWDYAFERPARSAIVEFAPRARFYAGGRHVQVNQVDVKGSKIEPWRFCDRCSYAAMVAGGDEQKSCPACGSTHWADRGQKRNMLKLRQVFANTNDRDSRITDDREERSPMFFNRQTLVTFGEGGDGNAWYISEETVPFGFEFVKSATFREINFGEFDDIGTKLCIAGQDAVRKGFTLCTDCGMVQGATKPEHARACKFADADDKAKYEECLYLYRQFSSEAVRLLLPFIDEPGYEHKLHSFVAALELGLRSYFGGRIDHLETTVHSEPVSEGTGRKQFLVLYDTVPGGTGYLHELVRDPQTIFEVLEIARARMVTCTCNNDAQKDGCYRCLFAYRHSYDMPATSRSTAVALITQILEHREKLKKVRTLGDVDVGVLVESVLERRFLEALRRRAQARGHEMSFGLEIVRGKPGYRFEVDGNLWLIEPQVDLGAAHGVVVDTRPDFVMWPGSESSGRRPIAIYTDGFQFHQSRIGKDLFQRMAVAACGRFLTWSLTWSDVEAAFGSLADWFDVIGARELDNRNLLLREGVAKGHWRRDASELDSLELLVELLAGDGSCEKEWAEYALMTAFLPIADNGGKVVTPEAWSRAVAEAAPPNVADALAPGEHCAVETRAPDGFVGRIFATISAKGLHSMDPHEMRVLVELDDLREQRERQEFPPLWNGVLRLFNILQFLKHAFFVTTTGQDDLPFGKLLERMVEPALTTDADFAWVEAEEMLLDDRYREYLRIYREAGLPAPRGGHEPEDDAGLPAGPPAEVAWPDAKVALYATADQDPNLEETLETMRAAGWWAFPIDHFADRPEELKALCEGA